MNTLNLNQLKSNQGQSVSQGAEINQKWKNVDF